MPAKGIAKLRELVSDPYSMVDYDTALAAAIEALSQDGPAGILDLVYLIKDLLAARNGAIGYALSVAKQMPPSKQLIDIVREVASASQLAPSPSMVPYRGEIVGPGQVGWATSTHAQVTKQAAAVLAHLEALAQCSAAEAPPDFPPVPRDATVVYEPWISDVESADYLRTLDYSPSARAWLLHYARYPDDPSTHYAKVISADDAYQFLLEDIKSGLTKFCEESREALERHFPERLRQEGITFPDRKERCQGCEGSGRTYSGMYCGKCKGDGWLKPQRRAASKNDAQLSQRKESGAYRRSNQNTDVHGPHEYLSEEHGTDPTDMQARFEKAVQLFRDGYFYASLRLLKEIDAVHPNRKEILFPIALCLESMGRRNDALLVCQQLIEQFDDSRAQQMNARIAEQLTSGAANDTPEMPITEALCNPKQKESEVYTAEIKHRHFASNTPALLTLTHTQLTVSGPSLPKTLVLPLSKANKNLIHTRTGLQLGRETFSFNSTIGSAIAAWRLQPDLEDPTKHPKAAVKSFSIGLGYWLIALSAIFAVLLLLFVDEDLDQGLRVLYYIFCLVNSILGIGLLAFRNRYMLELTGLYFGLLFLSNVILLGTQGLSSTPFIAGFIQLWIASECLQRSSMDRIAQRLPSSEDLQTEVNK